MNNTNTLTSGDNRGYASYLLEQHVNGKDVRARASTHRFLLPTGFTSCFTDAGAHGQRQLRGGLRLH